MEGREGEKKYRRVAARVIKLPALKMSQTHLQVHGTSIQVPPPTFPTKARYLSNANTSNEGQGAKRRASESPRSWLHQRESRRLRLPGRNHILNGSELLSRLWRQKKKRPGLNPGLFSAIATSGLQRLAIVQAQLDPFCAGLVNKVMDGCACPSNSIRNSDCINSYSATQANCRSIPPSLFVPIRMLIASVGITTFLCIRNPKRASHRRQNIRSRTSAFREHTRRCRRWTGIVASLPRCLCIRLLSSEVTCFPGVSGIGGCRTRAGQREGPWIDDRSMRGERRPWLVVPVFPHLHACGRPVRDEGDTGRAWVKGGDGMDGGKFMNRVGCEISRNSRLLSWNSTLGKLNMQSIGPVAEDEQALSRSCGEKTPRRKNYRMKIIIRLASPALLARSAPRRANLLV